MDTNRRELDMFSIAHVLCIKFITLLLEVSVVGMIDRGTRYQKL